MTTQKVVNDSVMQVCSPAAGAALRTTRMHYRHAITALVALALIFAPSAAAAEPDPCRDEPRPCALKRGMRAPWDGELWPSAFAMAVLEDRAAGEAAKGALAIAEADLKAERDGRAIDRKEAAGELAAERRAHAATRELARSLVEPPAWYERPAFLIITTAVVTLGATVATVYALR